MLRARSFSVRARILVGAILILVGAISHARSAKRRRCGWGGATVRAATHDSGKNGSGAVQTCRTRARRIRPALPYRGRGMRFPPGAREIIIPWRPDRARAYQFQNGLRVARP